MRVLHPLAGLEYDLFDGAGRFLGTQSTPAQVIGSLTSHAATRGDPIDAETLQCMPGGSFQLRSAGGETYRIALRRHLAATEGRDWP